MVINLRERVEADLATTLEKEWGLPVVLVDPDGETYDNRAGSEDSLVGQVLYSTIVLNPETGQEIVQKKPVVTLRRTSLERIPVDGERWLVKIPLNPSTTDTLVSFILDPTRSIEDGQSIGFIRLYLIKAEQS